MCGLPIFSANDVEGSRRDKVLHFAVVAATDQVGRIVANLKPDLWFQVSLGNCVPGDRASLGGNLARRQCSAERRDDVEAMEGVACGESWAEGVCAGAILVAACGEAVA